LWSLWRQGQQPQVDDFLAQAGVGDPGQILDAVLVDQAERFRLGQGVAAEAYLEAFPSLRDDPERAVDVIFAEYLHREERGEQPAAEEYLRRFPQHAAALQLQVELHQAMGADRAFPPTRAESSAAPLAPGETNLQVGSETPPKVPGYEILELLGCGGMGVVYRAWQQGLNRPVALKVIKPGMDSRQVIARFDVERKALALMDHANIATVVDAGTTDSGHPYFVMELVQGVPITEYCDRNRLTPLERLELFIPVCQAIQHAHQKGIIHRDVKPSNVLVTRSDGTAVPKVIDFGVAKAIDRRLTETTMFTQYDMIIGTFQYMSPEQAEMGTPDVDTRSDIYSLGVVLYELLTGSTPLEQAKLRGAACEQILRRIREEDPPRPSTRLSETKDQLATIAARRKTEPARLAKLVRGELDWIVMKALEKDRSRRYETANGLARDIQRYLDGDPVEAGPPSAAYRLMKLARRHRGALATAGTFALLLLLATAVSTYLAIKAARAERGARGAEAQAGRDRDAALAASRAEAEMRRRAEGAEKAARLEADKAQTVNRFLTEDLLVQAEPENNAAESRVTLREVLDRAAAKVGERFGEQPEVEAAVRRTIAETYHGLGAWGESERHWRTVREIERRRAGTESAAIWEAEAQIGHMLRHLGRYREALDLLPRAADGLRRVLGPDHHETLNAVDSLAQTYKVAGRLADAVPLYEDNLRRLKDKFGPDHVSTLTSMNNLANAYSLSGRLADAVPLLEETVNQLKAKFEPDHPYTLHATHNLAVTYRRVGRHADALRLFEDTLRRRQARLPPDHPDTLISMSNLAVEYRQVGRLTDALPLFEEALKRSKARLGPDHLDTLIAMNNLARAYRDMGRLADALPLLEDSLKRGQAQLDPDHPHLLVAMGDLADTYRDAGRLADALALYEETLKRSKAKLGPDHLNTLRAMNDLARAYLAGRRAEAEPLLRQALAIRQKKLPDDWVTFETRSLLGGILLDRKNYAEAEPLLVSGYEGLQARAAKIPAPAKNRLPEAGARVVALYAAWGKNDKAAEWRARLSSADKPARDGP
jgi:serine/threonine protein kinase